MSTDTLTPPSPPAAPPPGSRASDPQDKRDNWLVVAVAIAASSMVVAIVAVGIGISEAGDGGGAAASGDAVTVEVELGDLFIRPAKIDVPANAEVTFVVTNNGAEAAAITSLADDKFGPLDGDADCAVNTVLAAGASSLATCATNAD